MPRLLRRLTGVFYFTLPVWETDRIFWTYFLLQGSIKLWSSSHQVVECRRGDLLIGKKRRRRGRQEATLELWSEDDGDGRTGQEESERLPAQSRGSAPGEPLKPTQKLNNTFSFVFLPSVLSFHSFRGGEEEEGHQTSCSEERRDRFGHRV